MNTVEIQTAADTAASFVKKKMRQHLEDVDIMQDETIGKAKQLAETAGSLAGNAVKDALGNAFPNA